MDEYRSVLADLAGSGTDADPEAPFPCRPDSYYPVREAGQQDRKINRYAYQEWMEWKFVTFLDKRAERRGIEELNKWLEDKANKDHLAKQFRLLADNASWEKWGSYLDSIVEAGASETHA